jgi:alginate O-acetyltransferase complex protein AlgI
MVFSSPIFLFLFLPFVLVAYFLSPKFLKNIVLLIVSLLFYAWGEPVYILIMIFSIVFNYLWALLLGRIKKEKNQRLLLLFVGVVINLSLLFYYKYAVFFIHTINHFLPFFHIASISISAVQLPLGISFFTFHAISYLIDIHRGLFKPQKNLFTLALYVSFFPQLIAGPIIRYHTIAKQLEKRKVTLDLFASGVKRFIQGMGKKVLIADTLAVVADQVFAIPLNHMTTALTWLGIICYTLQIYFDFSGYSDMAIGLGRMFGFNISENFNFPYVANSIQDFWRRWHISLSNWFRDYLYIPLGGNRVSKLRLYSNLLIVFLLVGLWHGANWHFVAWGVYYGAFLVLERWKLSSIISSLWAPLQHVYVLIIVIIGWVLFRADNLNMAIYYIKSMFGIASHWPNEEFYVNYYLTNDKILALIAGIVLSIPLLTVFNNVSKKFSPLQAPAVRYSLPILELVFLMVIFAGAILALATGSYSPFLYFRF